MRPPGRSCSISAGGTYRRRGRDDDRVEWRALRPAEAAVAGAQFDVAATLFRQGPRRAGGQFGDHLDRADLVGKRGKHRCLVAGAGANLQYDVIRLEIKQFRHQRDDEGLRNGLGMTDRQRSVLIGRRAPSRAPRTPRAARWRAPPATLGDSVARPVQRAVSRIPSAICSISAARASSGCSMPPTLPVARPAV